MSYMFFKALVFNQPIGNWNVENVTNMSYMFSGALAFEHHIINNWNIKKNVYKLDMFDKSTNYNTCVCM